MTGPAENMKYMFLYTRGLYTYRCRELALITVKVDEDLKKRMASHADLNWSEVVRAAIEERLRAEETTRKGKLDRARIRDAIAVSDQVRDKTSGNWSVTEEIRRWRELRRP